MWQWLLPPLLLAIGGARAYDDDTDRICARYHVNCAGCIVAAAAGCRYCPADGLCSASDGDSDSESSKCATDDAFVVDGESCDAAESYRPEFDGREADDQDAAAAFR